MISHNNLKKIAKARFKDANLLFQNNRYDSAAYLCGYSIELILKAIICKELGLKGIPNTSQEFEKVIETLKRIKTHNLETLLSLISPTIQQETKSSHFSEWSDIQNWDPEMRYVPLCGELLKPEAEKIIKACKKLLKFFNNKI